MSHSSQEKMGNYNADGKKEHKLMRKGLAVALAGAVALGAAGCSGDKVGAKTPEINPSTTNEAVVEAQEVPQEAESFVKQYGSRYEDPVSTYYAAKALESEYGNRSLVMPNDFFENYNVDSQKNAVSSIGFELYSLPLVDEVGVEDFTKVFNEYVVKELSLYMNSLAKNPTPEAQQVIDFEFTNWCSDAMNRDNNPAPTKDEEYVANLMSICKGIVAEHGSSANYIVKKATNNEVEGESYVSPNGIVNVFKIDENGKIITFTNNLDMAIAIEKYNDSTSTRETLLISDIQLTYTRQPDGMIAIGQIGEVKITLQ